MNKENNSRSKATKYKIREALIELLSDGKKIETITVKDLCEKSAINRSTFYSYYSIPEDVLRLIEKETLTETLKYFSQMKTNSQDTTTSLLLYIKNNQRIFKILFFNNNSFHFVKDLIDQTFLIFMSLENLFGNKEIINCAKSYIINGAKAMIQNWMIDNFQLEAKFIANLLMEYSKSVINTSFKIQEALLLNSF